MTNIKFSSPADFDRYGDKGVGDVALLPDMSLIVKAAEGFSHVGGATSESVGGINYFRAGKFLVQFQRVSIENSPSHLISFPFSYDNDNVFVFLQEADNDPDHSIQLDGNNLPDRNGFTLLVNSQQGNGYAYWIAIGVRE